MSGALSIVISMVMRKILDMPTWYGLLLVWLVSLAVAYGATTLFNKYIPWLFDLRIFSLSHANPANLAKEKFSTYRTYHEYL